jgi:phosphatidylglycerophosphate synthase
VLSSLRQRVRPVGRWIAGPFVRANISPNAITLAAIPLSTAAAFCTANSFFLLGFGLAVPAMLLDFLDGAVARASKKQTAFGNHLEAVVDRYVEGALLAGLSVHFPILATACLTLSMLVSYIKARVGLVIQADNSDWPGVGDRADRMVLLAFALLSQALGSHLGCERILVFLLIIAGFGCVQRVFHSKRLIERAEEMGELLNSEET